MHNIVLERISLQFHCKDTDKRAKKQTMVCFFRAGVSSSKPATLAEAAKPSETVGQRYGKTRAEQKILSFLCRAGVSSKYPPTSKKQYIYLAVSQKCTTFAIASTAYGGLAQLARALVWHARGHRFEPDILHKRQTGGRICNLPFTVYLSDPIIDISYSTVKLQTAICTHQRNSQTNAEITLFLKHDLHS